MVAIVGSIQVAVRRPYYCSDENEKKDDDHEDNEDEPVELVSLRVKLLRNLNEKEEDKGDEKVEDILSRQSYDRKVRIYHFDEFDNEGGERLWDFMMPLRELILRKHEPTLRKIHQRFRQVLNQILVEKRHFPPISNHNTQHPSTDTTSTCTIITTSLTPLESPPVVVACFAQPNLRLRNGNYATFLHADAVYDDDDDYHRCHRRGGDCSHHYMINIWIPLMDIPISITNYPLCFLQCSRDKTIFSENKLYYAVNYDGDHYDNGMDKKEDEGLCMAWDPSLQWGKFVCFVAGEPKSNDSVLLHGAVRLEGEEDETTTHHEKKEEEFVIGGVDSLVAKNKNDTYRRKTQHRPPRMSLELRYLV
jgi:hypothetical protein